MGGWLVRADAGTGLGLGHLSRCRSLLAALRETGRNCVLCVAGDFGGAPSSQDAPAEFIPLGTDDLGSDADLSRILTLAGRHGCDGVAVDSYHIGSAYLAGLRRAGKRVVAIDDLAAFPFPAHVVVNGAVSAAKLPYNSSEGDTRFLLGAEYALLRREFWEAREKEIRVPARDVLVTMGGADSANASDAVLRGLSNVDDDLRVALVVGPYCPHVAGLRELARQLRHPVSVIVDPPNMPALMQQADLAISASGQTLYELAVTGTPTVAVCTAENQRSSFDAFARNGAVLPVHHGTSDGLSEEITVTVSSVMGDVGARRALSVAAQALVPGAGARRVAAALTEDE